MPTLRKINNKFKIHCADGNMNKAYKYIKYSIKHKFKFNMKRCYTYTDWFSIDKCDNKPTSDYLASLGYHIFDSHMLKL